MDYAVNRSGNNSNDGKHGKWRVEAFNHEPAAMSPENHAASVRKAYVEFLDSGGTSLLTPPGDVVQSKTSSDMLFTLSDNWQMRATHNGVRKVHIQGEDGVLTISFSIHNLG